SLSPDDLEDDIDDVRRRTLVTVKGLQDRLRRRGRVVGGGTLSRFLDERTGGRPSGSGLQNDFRRELSGLPQPLEEFPVCGPDGRLIAYVDLAYPQIKGFIEIDGWKYHSGRKKWELDGERQNKLALAGWTPYRFSKSALRNGTFRKTIETLLRGV